MTTLRITRTGPLATIQDAGRPGCLSLGVSASGPMDRAAFASAGHRLGRAGRAGIEFTTAGIGFHLEGDGLDAAFAGGDFRLRVGGRSLGWPWAGPLAEGDEVEILPGGAGNYGYARFSREIDLPPVLGSVATNLVAGLGGLEGRALRAGDLLSFGPFGDMAEPPPAAPSPDGAVRIIWGIHADLFPAALRAEFTRQAFHVSPRLDRMGVRLEDRAGVFAGAHLLSLVSEPVAAGDIQVLGDGTPIVLIRDHQPTGGYPRIATVATADLDRFAQLRPGAAVQFQPVTADHARRLLG